MADKSWLNALREHFAAKPKGAAAKAAPRSEYPEETPETEAAGTPKFTYKGRRFDLSAIVDPSLRTMDRKHVKLRAAAEDGDYTIFDRAVKNTKYERELGAKAKSQSPSRLRYQRLNERKQD